jgi:hypothetical protein
VKEITTHNGENVGIPDDFNGSKPHTAPGRRILYHFCDCRVESKRGIIRRVKYWGCVSAGDSNGRIIFIADAHREFIGCNKCHSFNL